MNDNPLITLGALAILLSLVCLLGHCAGTKNCELIAEETGLKTRYRLGVGCLIDVKDDGHFIPYHRWRVVD